MPDSFIGVDVTGIEEVQKQLKRLGPDIQDAVVMGVSQYLIKQFQIYPPPNHRITRKKAYGKTFFTNRQRRWFFWALHNHLIRVPYRRTQGLRKAWQIIGKGKDAIVVNETQAAVFTMGDTTRARFSKLVGWRTMEEIIDLRMKQISKEALVSANQAIKKSLRKSRR